MNGIQLTGATKSEFAKIIGRSKAMVTKHDHAGHLIYTPEGLVDVEASKDRIASLKAPDRGGPPVQKKPASTKPERAPETDMAAEPVRRETYEDVRTVREKQNVEITAIKLAEAKRELIGRKGVLKAIQDCAAEASKRFALIPDQIASRVAAETDVHKCHAILSEAIDSARADLAKDADALSEPLSSTLQ